MIKKIYCFGTSHTKGAGFHLPQVKSIYKNVVKYPNMENCSWPGILKTYIDDDIQINNLAEHGAGNERMYRLVFDLLSDPNFKKEETLLLLEMSSLGRKEYYSNTINDYVICNYVPTHPPGNNFDVVWKYYTHRGSLAPKRQSDMWLSNKVKKIYSDFLVETVNFDDLLKKLQMNLLFFINFLDSHNIKYEFINFDDIFSPNQRNSFDVKLKTVKYTIEGEETLCFYDNNKFLFEHETDGMIDDEHQGYFANLIGAGTIYNHLIKKEYIDGNLKEIKSTYSDFLEFKKKLYFDKNLI